MKRCPECGRLINKAEKFNATRSRPCYTCTIPDPKDAWCAPAGIIMLIVIFILILTGVFN